DAAETEEEDAVETEEEDAAETEEEDAAETEEEDAAETEEEDAVETEAEDAVETEAEDAAETEEEDTRYGKKIASGLGNASGNVTWDEYESENGETTLVFHVENASASAADCAITISMKGTAQAGRVTAIVLEPGITGIGWTTVNSQKQAAEIFQDFSVLRSVSPCASLRQIGWSSFRRCNKLSGFPFAACPNLEMIAQQAFNPTASLRTADLSGCSRLSYIGPSAFNQGNKSSCTVILPAHEIAVIGSNAFQGVTVIHTEIPEEDVIETVHEIRIDYRVVETKSAGSLHGSLPTVVGGNEDTVMSDESIQLRSLSADTYVTARASEQAHFPYFTYVFKGWLTERNEILAPGACVEAAALDADGNGTAVLSTVWSGSWQSGSGTPSANFSIWTNAASLQACLENGTLIGENVSSYSPKVGAAIMLALDAQGRTITPDQLVSPSHGNNGTPNVGTIYNSGYHFADNNQGKYLMVSYLGSSITSADSAVRTLAVSGLRTTDSESGDVTWKLSNLPSDAEVLNKLASYVRSGMTVLRDENGRAIEADELTTENYSILWCQVKYQSGSADGWNINGVLCAKAQPAEEPAAESEEEIPAAEEETPAAEEETAEAEEETPAAEEETAEAEEETPAAEEETAEAEEETPAAEEEIPAAEEEIPAAEEETPAAEEETPAAEEETAEAGEETPAAEEETPAAEEETPAAEEETAEAEEETPAAEEEAAEDEEESAVEEASSAKSGGDRKVKPARPAADPAPEANTAPYEIILNDAVPAAAPVIPEEQPAAVNALSLKNRQNKTLAPSRAIVLTEELHDSKVPMAEFSRNTQADNGWALIDLICMLLGLYILLPLLGIKAKFERASELSRNTFDDLDARDRSFLFRFRLGIAAEIMTVIISLAVIVLTQDFSAGMVLTDSVTPLMAVLCAACGAIEYIIRRERSEEAAEA
ncbi:MAG: leucine-rich repeat protein, partial [Oscillospiraceae bacterium]|nr:leucine-rich repeat protein [Oscillospiraceae bacterium]